MISILFKLTNLIVLVCLDLLTIYYVIKSTLVKCFSNKKLIALHFVCENYT